MTKRVWPGRWVSSCRAGGAGVIAHQLPVGQAVAGPEAVVGVADGSGRAGVAAVQLRGCDRPVVGRVGLAVQAADLDVARRAVVRLGQGLAGLGGVARGRDALGDRPPLGLVSVKERGAAHAAVDQRER
jgi:hypothetical protein